jgi:hypothetical protein
MVDKKNLIDIIEEEGGYFINLRFDNEEKATLFFVAESDFASLSRLAANPEKDWEDLREELFVLLHHTGHKKKHTLGKETVLEVMEFLKDFKT